MLAYLADYPQNLKKRARSATTCKKLKPSRKLPGGSKKTQQTDANSSLKTEQPSPSELCQSRRPSLDELRQSKASNGKPKRSLPSKLEVDTNVEPPTPQSLQSCTPAIARSPALSSSGPVYTCGEVDLAETAIWLFYSHVRQGQAHLFVAAKAHWVDKLWDMAREHELILRCTSLSMLLKKASLTGKRNSMLYYAQKEQLFRCIQRRLAGISGTAMELDLALAIAMLAEFESRDTEDLASSKTHIQALSKLIPVESLHGLAWRVAVRVDLRQALLSGERPTLPYYVPIEYRRRLNDDTMIWTAASSLAGKNCRSLPESAFFDQQDTYELFRNLHQLCLSWDTLIHDIEPPFAHVYNLAYRLRVLQAVTGYWETGGTSSPMELVIIALQFHIWVISRFWTVQTRLVHSTMLGRASRVLQSDLLKAWSSSGGSMSSALWVLATLFAASFDMGSCDNAVISSHLLSVCKRLKIGTLQDFEAHLQQWPWLENWHGPRSELIWNHISQRSEDAASACVLSQKAADILRASQSSRDGNERWFLGGLEFYSSL